jgi:hypothetical protein
MKMNKNTQSHKNLITFHQHNNSMVSPKCPINQNIYPVNVLTPANKNISSQ